MTIPNTKPEREVIDNTEAVRTFHDEGGRIVHFRPGDGERGITFAYKRKGGRATFATSVQHRADTFTKKMGTKLALEHFHAGHVVSLPLSSSNADVVRNLGLVAQVIQF